MSATSNSNNNDSGSPSNTGNASGESVTTPPPILTGKEPNRFSATNKSARSGRKISLPWFRQNSLTSASALSRQHTIDSPGSYRYFKQVSENNAKVHIVSFIIHIFFVLLFLSQKKKSVVFVIQRNELNEQFTKVILVCY